MNIYLFIGGAYGDDYFVQHTPPDADQLRLWSSGELLIFRVDSEMRIYEVECVDGSDADWILVKTFPPKQQGRTA